MSIIDIGPECFASADVHVISYKGDNYYKSCDEFVADRPKGGQTFCVKRIGHPGTIHEDWDGLVRSEEPIAIYDAALDLANAIRLTVEYVGNDMLPAQVGWSWFDALNRYNPEMVRQFIEKPIRFLTSDSIESFEGFEPWLFKGNNQPTTLSEVIGQGIGAGSACWENLAGAGIFESTRARSIVEEMIAWIQEHYILRNSSDVHFSRQHDDVGPFKRQKVRLITDKNNGQTNLQDYSEDD